MIETEQSALIEAGIDTVWAYVQDIRRWANLFPGCRECVVVNEHDSQWLLKVGAGGLIKTVKVAVHVERWVGPHSVAFTYRLDGEPVQGSGTYTAQALGARQTQISLKVVVNGSGPMAPMWEAVSRPLLPQLAKLFAGKLKAEIEAQSPAEPTPSLAPAMRPGLWRRLARWWSARFA